MTNRSKTRGKAEWRRWAKATRAQLDVATSSEKAIQQLGRWPLYRRAEHVLTYLAFRDELDLSGLKGKHFYTTRTHEDGTLSVHMLEGELERHPYGFRQPHEDSPVVAVQKLQLLLVPGLAFDLSGNRLGYGRGFYDRLLPNVRSGVPIVGVAPSQLIISALPAEPHDVRMTHLLSEKGVAAVGNER